MVSIAVCDFILNTHRSNYPSIHHNINIKQVYNCFHTFTKRWTILWLISGRISPHFLQGMGAYNSDLISFNLNVRRDIMKQNKQ